MDNPTRDALTFARDLFARSEARLYDQISATFRWVLATMFTANGGAVLGLLGTDNEFPGQIWAAGWFSLGVVFAILMGISSIFASLKAAPKINAIYVKAQEGLVHDQDVSTEIVTMANDMKVDWTPSHLGFVSFGFFILGLATIAGSLIRASN